MLSELNVPATHRVDEASLFFPTRTVIIIPKQAMHVMLTPSSPCPHTHATQTMNYRH